MYTYIKIYTWAQHWSNLGMTLWMPLISIGILTTFCRVVPIDVC
jgi:hypothetical protein